MQITITSTFSGTITSVVEIPDPPPVVPPVDPPPNVPVDPPPPDVPSGSTFAVAVNGKNLTDGAGKVIQLRGVNRPGPEFAPVEGTFGFLRDNGDGKATDPQIAARYLISNLATWNDGLGKQAINCVRVPLNESAWLGINGVAPSFAGDRYKAFVRQVVASALAARVYVILDLHWSAPGAYLANQQDVAPNADHSITFWSQVASEFKADKHVLFDLFNEPRIWDNRGVSTDYNVNADYAWKLYRDGGPYTLTAADGLKGRPLETRTVAGTQQLVDAIRKTGSTAPILVEGLGWGNALDRWETFKPRDPLNQLVCSQHVYASSGSRPDTDMTMRLAAANAPVLIGEFGQTFCGTVDDGFAQKVMDLADRNGYSYTAWGWDSNMGCQGPSLVTNNTTGAPSAYGKIVQAHLRAKAAP